MYVYIYIYIYIYICKNHRRALSQGAAAGSCADPKVVMRTPELSCAFDKLAISDKHTSVKTPDRNCYNFL